MRICLLIVVFTALIVPEAHGEPRAQSTASGAPAATVRSPRLPGLLGAEADPGFARVSGPHAFSFPEDHGPHPAFRNEWWYFTGNLDSRDGERFGFELALFRFALAPAAAPQADASAWRTRQAYVGHFAITDAENREFHVAERYARAALGLAGATASPFHVWVEDWWIKEFAHAGVTHPSWLLHANDAHFGLTVTLVPESPPVLNGIDGLSQKSAEPGNASYYYSIPRLTASGTLRIDDAVYDVSGLSWFDREWSSSPLSKEQQGWDWFALQLSDGSNLMFYRLRRTDGSTDAHSAGTWMPGDGKSLHLGNEDVAIEVRAHWDSPEGGRYPMAWSIDVPGQKLKLEITPVLDAQELNTGVRYWEGAVDVSGRRAGQPVSGRGYVELTGYAERPGDTTR